MVSLRAGALSLAFVLFFGLAAASDPYEPGPVAGLPWFKPEEVLKGKLPYATLYRLDLVREALRNPGKNIPHEWHVPLSTLEGSRAVARDLVRAWQRLEERTYWHVMSRIHYTFGTTELACKARELLWSQTRTSYELNPARPEVEVGVGPDQLPAGFAPPLPLREAAGSGALRLDWYSYFHGGSARVPPSDYCDDLGNGDFPIFPVINGSCVKALGVKICTPGYPGPLFIDMGELEGRARRGIEHAAKAYIPDYEKDVLAAVAPRGNPLDFVKALSSGKVQDPEVFVPTDWSGALLGSGALLTPVVRLVELPQVKDDLEAVWDALQKAKYADGKLQSLKELYYLPALKGLLDRVGLGGALSLPSFAEDARSRAVSLLTGPSYRSELARGVWPLEELKRWFPPSRPEVHEALGYTTYFQVFGRLDFTVLPDPGARWNPGEYAGYSFVRSLHIWHVPVIVDWDLCSPALCPVPYPDVPNIRPIFIAPYEIFYVGPRYYYDWVSVPESYPIPRVKGIPLGTPVPR